MSRISIVGGGNVGASAAFRLLDIAQELVIIDVDRQVIGKALDLGHASDCKTQIKASTDIGLLADSDIVIITAGMKRQPGMSRADLFETNRNLLSRISESIAHLAPKAIIIVVTNPVDLMTKVVFDATGFEARRIMGMGSLLDSMRFRYYLSRAMAGARVDGMVIGSHDDLMVPLIDQARADARKIPEHVRESVLKDTKDAGAEVARLGGTSSYYGPAVAIAQMCDAILYHPKELPVSAFLQGEYGFEGFFIGVPAQVGKKGVGKITEIKFSEKERKMFEKSAKKLKETYSEYFS